MSCIGQLRCKKSVRCILPSQRERHPRLHHEDAALLRTKVGFEFYYVGVRWDALELT
jgi:hypothetical protein